jgi:hypothetical protein
MHTQKRPWWLWIPFVLSWVPGILLIPFLLFVIAVLPRYLGGGIALLLLLIPMVPAVFAWRAIFKTESAFKQNNWSETVNWCLAAYLLAVLAFFLVILPFW